MLLVYRLCMRVERVDRVVLLISLVEYPVHNRILILLPVFFLVDLLSVRVCMVVVVAEHHHLVVYYWNLSLQIDILLL